MIEGSAPASMRRLGGAERRVPRPAIGADDAHAALEQIHRRRQAHAATTVDVVILAVPAAGAGVDQHDVERGEAMADAGQLGLDFLGLDDMAVGFGAEVQLHAGVEAPFQRHLVDPQGGPAAWSQRLVLAREIVVRRVHMRAVMGRDGDALDRGVLALRQGRDRDAHVLRHARCGIVVVHVLDLRLHAWRVGFDPRFQAGGDVDVAAGHAACAFSRVPRHSPKPMGVAPGAVAWPVKMMLSPSSR